jgi:agmatinase
MGMFHHHGPGNDPFDRGRLRGMQVLRRLKDITDRRTREQLERGLDLGLEAAPSVQDRTISLFSRGQQPAFAGINTFTKAPYCENIRDVGKYDVAVVGAPFDMGTTYRAGCRFGPQAVRRISALYDSYNADMGVDLFEELNLCDAGDIFVIPSNIEKSFDQIDGAVSFIHEQGAFPVVIGGDHSIGYPDMRAIAPHIEGKVGIIHLDRHIDMQERDMDERMHTTPWFHASNIPNAPPANLVQMGIGGWYGSRPGMKVARERGSTVITISDVEELGIEKAVEVALECAWKDAEAVFLSFDIDSIDSGFVPGTGSPEPGGLLPREALKALRMVAREGICGMEVVEIAPPYDVSDMTAQLGARAIMDVLGTMVEEGHLGTRPSGEARERRERERADRERQDSERAGEDD